MPEPKTLGRVDWMPRLKVWRVIWYKGAADVPAGDYPTKKEAEDALRKLVARGNPTPEVTEKRIPRDIIIRKEVEPLYPSGYKYVAYEADGTPLYIGEETAKAAEARVRTQMPVKSIRVSEVAIPKAPAPEVTREFVIETHSPMGQPYKTIVQFTPTENTEANRVMQEIKDKFTKFNNEQQSEAKAVLTQLHGEKRPYMGFYEKNMQELNLINDYMDRISSGKFDIHQLLRDAENVKLAIPKAEAGNPGVTPEIKIEERALLYHLATANQKESVESYLRKRFGDEILDKLHKERLIGREPKGLYYITLRGREVAGKIPPKGANLYAEAKKILEEGLEVKSPAPPKASGNPGSTAKEAKSVERLGKGETLNNLLPMPPTDGPPLPRMLDLKWPWKK